ncbi:FAD-binding oxidoreductase [Aspergillus lucknowensis]|uniref:FAD-binding domain-containing protein n=1 Tax=Aspergillus lucknowensis TaxID=176173 RepID=A0ABR4LDD5_9EURO
MHHSICSLLGLIVLCAAAQADGVNLTSLYGLGLSNSAEILYASDSDFEEETTHRWTLYHAPTYYGAIKPATEADIQHIVRTSVEHDIPFLATGGGHGVTRTLGRLQNGISIDLSNFQTVELDEENSFITVGGAATYQQTYEPMYRAGMMMAMGNAPCVGVVGAALGGAVGMWQGLYGVGIDSLVSVRLVTATGDLVVASQTENAELFWAIRGAGANFGIVTSATFQLQDAVNNGNVASTSFVFPAKHNASVWEAVRSFDTEIPDELAVTAIASFNHTAQEPTILVNVNYYGPALDAAQYLRPFEEAGPLAAIPVTLPWTTLQQLSLSVDAAACTPGQYVADYSIALKQTDVDAYVSAFNALTAFWEEHEAFAGVLVIDRYPNAVAKRVADGETAYPHREAIAHLLIENHYPDSSLDDSVNALMRETRARFQATSGFDELSVYVNFAQGDEGAEAWYSSRKLERLKELKRAWDPNELFSYSNPIPI